MFVVDMVSVFVWLNNRGKINAVYGFICVEQPKRKDAQVNNTIPTMGNTSDAKEQNLPCALGPQNFKVPAA
jgi:hypothetical protein